MIDIYTDVYIDEYIDTPRDYIMVDNDDAEKCGMELWNYHNNIRLNLIFKRMQTLESSRSDQG